jgi:hypothetical protein
LNKRIEEDLACNLEGDAVLAEIGGRLIAVPYKRLALKQK